MAYHLLLIERMETELLTVIGTWKCVLQAKAQAPCQARPPELKPSSSTSSAAAAALAGALQQQL
jgi:hypothetical protein